VPFERRVEIRFLDQQPEQVRLVVLAAVLIRPGVADRFGRVAGRVQPAQPRLRRERVGVIRPGRVPPDPVVRPAFVRHRVDPQVEQRVAVPDPPADRHGDRRGGSLQPNAGGVADADLLHRQQEFAVRLDRLRLALLPTDRLNHRLRFQHVMGGAGRFD
jgi:hypothetical protein